MMLLWAVAPGAKQRKLDGKREISTATLRAARLVLGVKEHCRYKHGFVGNTVLGDTRAGFV